MINDVVDSLDYLMLYFWHVRFPYAYVVACFSSDIPIMIVMTI